MNSTKILFLNMIKTDILNYVKSKGSSNKISIDEIHSFPSYKLMNTEEKEIIDFILTNMKRKDTGQSNNKVMSKHINGLVPRSNDINYDYRDVA